MSTEPPEQTARPVGIWPICDYCTRPVLVRVPPIVIDGETYISARDVEAAMEWHEARCGR